MQIEKTEKTESARAANIEVAARVVREALNRMLNRKDF